MGTEFSYVIFLLRTMLWPLKNKLTLSPEDYLCVCVGCVCYAMKQHICQFMLLSPQFKESALRKQSLYLKFDPLLRDSPRKPISGTVETTMNIMTAPLQCG